uniref:Uncharacterized protein n=1 Tax=viral metagenome TaxID=1070528 RepID=A0A6H1ZZ53_9ZZZZ
MNNCVLGIDPGYSGAIAVFNCGQPNHVYDIRVYDMPILKTGKKTELDEVELFTLFDNLLFGGRKVSAFVEKAQTMPGQGIASTGRYLVGYGQILGILAGLRIPKTLVHPRTWKAKMMRDMEKEKQASILRCKQLFPEFAQQHLTLKKHHGRADAILIGYFGMQTGG